jgi:hypothetical protein
MRRVAAVLIVFGCALAGSGAWGAGAQGAAAPAGNRAADTGSRAAPAVSRTVRAGSRVAAAGLQVVRFAGYTIEVPAAWPVYRLARDPSQCVRYDQNAVYLGQPGTNQQCPAHLVGRVATLSLAVARLTVSERRQLPARGVVAWDTADHEMGALLPRHALSITATYGAAAGQIKGILATLRWAATGQTVATVLTRGATPGTPAWPTARFLRHRAGAALTRGATPGTPAWPTARFLRHRAGAALTRGATPGTPAWPTARFLRHRAGAALTRGATPGTPASPTALARGALPQGPLAGLSGAARRAAPRAGPAAAGAGLLPGQPARGRHKKHHRCHYRCCHHRLCHPRWLRMPVKGMDTCAAPSLRAMRSWYRAFKAAAIYLGGPEAACGWGNLSAAWIRASVRMGWAVIPTYVGPQAPCSGFRVRIRPGRAEGQGRASARNAIRLAQALRMHRGAVLYDDMEGYRSHHGRCSRPVVAFLDGWTRELHARGYRAGVYSSAGAAARDLGRYRHVYGHPVARPNSVWFALWDGRRNLRGRPYLRNDWWRGHRIKQYRGGRRRRIGGIRLSFDSDLVDGAVYR